MKELEEKGIGRPSTYASILSVLVDRQYVHKMERKFLPTELGFLVTDLLVGSFADIMEIEYTARMEEQLDEIEEGRANYLTTIDGFYQKFSKDLIEAREKMTNVKAMEIPTSEVCDKCGKPMVIKWGRFGHFLACSGYPECRNTREIQNYADKESADPDVFQDETCEKCSRPMVLKKGRYGQFLACSGYPGVQEHPADPEREGRVARDQARSASRREVPEVRKPARHQARPLRRVHRLQQLPRLQAHQAEGSGRRLSQGQLQGPGGGEALAPGEGLLRLQRVPELRLHQLVQARGRALPRVRLPGPLREIDEARRDLHRLHRRGLRLPKEP